MMYGSSAGDPVNLATGEEEYSPAPDLVVYNPNGPAVIWQRKYNSLRGWDLAYHPNDFGQGWTHPYQVYIQDSAPTSVAVPTNPSQTPQAHYSYQVPITGTQAPSDPDHAWEVYHNGTLISFHSISNPQNQRWLALARENWTFNSSSGPTKIPATEAAIDVPIEAEIGTGYTFRCFGSKYGVAQVDPNSFYSGSFEVVATTIVPDAGNSKYLVMESGARIRFGNTQVASPSVPVVPCSVEPGYGLYIEMRWDATTSKPCYVVTFKDQTQWRLECCFAGVRSYQFTSTELYYVLTRVTDRVGNAVSLVYSGISNFQPYTVGLPLLQRINDASTGQALLTLNRNGSGYLTSVSDCYGRSVYYQPSSPYYVGFSMLDEVSQVVSTGAANPPMRYQYSYQYVPNALNDGGFPMTSITVPSPTGTGTSTTNLECEPYTEFITRITDANGNITTFTAVNSDGSPWDPNDPNNPWDGSTGNHTKVSVKDPLENVVYSYITSWDANMSETTRTDGVGNVVSSKVFSDSSSPYSPTSVTDGENRTWQRTFDSYGNMLTEVTARGTLTTYTWDYTDFALGRMTSMQAGGRPAAPVEYYEPSGLIKKVTNASPVGSGTVTKEFTWDALGNLLTFTGSGNNAVAQTVISMSYTADGLYSQAVKRMQPLALIDSLGQTKHWRYDSQGRLISIRDALGSQSDITHNIAGQEEFVYAPATNQQGNYRSYKQNVYLYPGGPLMTQRHYDESGALVRIMSHVYGQEGEALGTSGTGDDSQIVYDALYRLSAVSDAAGHFTTYQYDTRGNIAQISYPGGDVAQFTAYDNSGRLTSQTDPRGIVSQYTYGDPDGFLTAISFPAYSVQNTVLSYDVYGRLQSKANAEGTHTYSYGDMDQVLSIVTEYTGLPTQTLAYTYHPDGSRATMMTPAGTFTYSYDAVGRLAALDNPFNEVTTWSYLANNFPIYQLSNNGLKAEYGFNALGQIISVCNRQGGTIVSQFSDISYSGVGNRLQADVDIPGTTALNGLVAYGYDSKNQVTSENRSGSSGYLALFAYDSAGNPTTFAGQTRTYNSRNQLQGSGMVHDASGNPTTYNGVALSFDTNNCLTACGSLMSAGYGTDNMRAWKEVNSQRIYFIYDGMTPVLELDSLGNVITVNTSGPLGLISRTTASASSIYYAFDERGNTVQRLDSTGTILSNRITSAFGTTIGSPSTNDPYDGFGARLGYYTDHETGLVLCGLRYYDPATSHWLTRDPIGSWGGSNLYRFCGNNPITFADPLGLNPLVDAAIGAAIGCLVGAVSNMLQDIARAKASGKPIDTDSLVCTIIGGCLSGGLMGGLLGLITGLGGPAVLGFLGKLGLGAAQIAQLEILLNALAQGKWGEALGGVAGGQMGGGLMGLCDAALPKYRSCPTPGDPWIPSPPPIGPVNIPDPYPTNEPDYPGMYGQPGYQFG